jgi:hypothetical protein
MMPDVNTAEVKYPGVFRQIRPIAREIFHRLGLIALYRLVKAPIFSASAGHFAANSA